VVQVVQVLHLLFQGQVLLTRAEVAEVATQQVAQVVQVAEESVVLEIQLVPQQLVQ
jgi:hypothetical protein